MYLVCCIENQSSHSIEQLQQSGIDSKPLVLMRCVPDVYSLDDMLTKYAAYDYIFLVSPTCIDVCRELITDNHKNITFGVMGEASLKHFQSYNQFANIISPKNNSGAKALINECLNEINFSNKRSLILQGDDGDESLANYFESNKINYDKLQVYVREKVEPDISNLQALLESDILSGIIITSSLLVDRLFEIANKYAFHKYLVQQRFITIHPKIMNRLHLYGVEEIYTTSSTAKQNIIDLIKRLDNNE